MSSHHYNYENPAAPLGCLNEHLNYFSENLATGQEFEDIFTKDFDLVFDPILLMNSDEATVARPVQFQSEPRESQPAPTPMAVPSYAPAMSRSFVPPPPSFAAAKPVIRVPERKPVAPEVSPTSVTAVFESLPAASTPLPKSSPRKRSYSMVSTKPAAPKPAPVTSSSAASESTDTSNLSFQEQEDLRR